MLKGIVDDTTSRRRARFSETDTTRASYDDFEDWVRRRRLPSSLYRHQESIYGCGCEPSVADQLRRKVIARTLRKRAGAVGASERCNRRSKSAAGGRSTSAAPGLR